MIVQNFSTLVYDPLDVSFNIVAHGGSTGQMKENISGRYDPDRFITPLLLNPTLQVVDPNHVISDGDYSSQLIDVRWFANEATDANRIVPKADAALDVGTDGSLLVYKNLEPGESLTLICTASFVDPRRGEVLKFRMELPLSCTAVSDASLTLNFDAPVRMPICPFKGEGLRTLHAQLVNGSTPLDDELVTCEWAVVNEHHLVGSDDDWYVSGQGTKNLTIDTRFIGSVNLEVRAWLKADKNIIERATTKIHRWYGQYRERIDVDKGQIVTTDTTKCEVKVTVATNRWGELEHPQDYFDIAIAFKKDLPGEAWRIVGYGDRVSMPIADVNPKYGVNTVFGAQVRELSELRPAKIGSQQIVINGQRVFMRVPTTDSDV